MVIGRGLLAKAISKIDSKKFVFYANGISNSVLHQIPRNNVELNEIKEIAHKSQEAVFVYFSTCQVNSVYNHERPYVKHKIFIETYIKDHFAKYLIIRASNLVGYNPWNRHTLFNYLYHALTVNEQITINPVLYRNFLDADHFVKLVETYLNTFTCNVTVEIVNPVSYRMDEIVNEFEKYFLKKFIVEKINDSNDFAVFDLNTGLSLDLFAQCDVCTRDYIPYLLKKYYKVLSPQTHTGN